MKESLKTDYWIYLLRFGAGFLNAVSMLKFSIVIATQTGILGDASIAFVQEDYSTSFTLLTVGLSFFLGSVISGIIFPNNRLQNNYANPIVLLLFSLVFFLAHFFQLQGLAALCLLTFAIGLQNGMFLYHKGSIIRTTMITGNITDIGVSIGQKIRGKEKEADPILFRLFNILFFLLGILVAALIYRYTSWSLFLLAALSYLVIGLVIYYWIKQYNQGC